MQNADIEGVKSKVSFINMDATNIDINKKFDIVIWAFILSHLWRSNDKILSRIITHTNPGAKILIVDNYISFTYFLLSTPHLYLYSYLRKRKATYLYKKNWIALIEKYNIETLNIKYKPGIICLIAKKRR